MRSPDDRDGSARRTGQEYLSGNTSGPRCGAPRGGYALSAGPDFVDAVGFERLVASGRALFGRGETAAAAGHFREALGLWRGPALAGVFDVEPLAREAARLEEVRLVAVEGRIEADIELGLHAEVTGELEGPGRGVSAAGAVVAAAGAGAVPGRAAG